MSLQTAQDGRPVHFPADPGKFSFDDEVARIFPDMARRAIPNFYEFHAMHAGIVREGWYKEGMRIADFGASRGAFISACREEFNVDDQHVVMTDVSDAMLGFLRQDFPRANVLKLDIRDGDHMSDLGLFDVINMTYVLQFLPPRDQFNALSNVLQCLRPGGLVILGQKNSSTGPLDGYLHEQYIRFRLNSGYTREEIEAKSAALKNSMWPISRLELERWLTNCGVWVTRETTRYACFGTLVGVKTEK